MRNPFEKRFLGIAAFILLLIFFASAELLAEALSYDRYDASIAPAKQDSNLKKTLCHLPVYPFEIVRYPISTSLVFMEKHHVMEKIQWFYDTLQNKGITPKFNLINLAQMNVGGEVDLVRALHQKDTFPNLIADAWVHYTAGLTFKTGSKIGMDHIGGTGFRTLAYFQYEDRPYERFYGVGPKSSLGEGYKYDREETNLEYRIGFKPDLTHRTDFIVGYRNTNISTSHRAGGGEFGQGLMDSRLPGQHGDELLILKTEYEHDTRNLAGLSTKGGNQRIAFSYNEGVSGSNAGFFKTEAEFSHYFRLGSDRRVLALHAYGEHNNERSGHEVPFHQMPRLGGHDSFDHPSQSFRGYQVNRFTDKNAMLFNMEYRYNIWEYREWKTDAFIFFDEGQVFKKPTKFKLFDFKSSYGTGVRTSLANFTVLSLEVAHGDEGIQLYAKSSTPF